MSPVVGSRHYQGPGLGEAMWKCPSCGAENQGPIAAGCLLCGAGTPGQKAEAEPPPPPPPPAPVHDDGWGRVRQPEPEPRQSDVADSWAEQHQGVTIADAYRTGYLDGMHAALQARATKQQQEQTFTPEGKIGRTIVAALMIFRDQVLATEPEEIASGEWMSVAEVTQLIRQISQESKV